MRFRELAVTVKSRPTTRSTFVVFVSGPLVPVNVRLYSPEMAREATVTFNTDVADCPEVSITLGGAKATVTPGNVLFERPTIPLKVFRLLRVMFVALDEPCSMTSCVRLELRLNPGFFTTMAMLVVWEMEPIVAFKRTLYMPTEVVGGTLTVSETPEVPPDASDTVVELSDGISPPVATEERLALPVKPLKLVSAIVDIAEEPLSTIIELGMDDSLNP